MRGSGKDGSGCGGGGRCVKVTFWTFEGGRGGYQNLTSANKGWVGSGGMGGRGPNFEHFVIT